MKIEGCVALVTGANRGLGKAFAEALLDRGASKVYAGMRDPSTGSGADPRLVPLQLDVTSTRDVAAVAARCTDLTLLVNNAGAMLMTPMLKDDSDSALRREMEVNVYGVLALTRAFAPILGSNGGGAIVNTGSIGSMVGQLKTPAYIASKGAIALLTKTLALDYGRDHIRVNCLCPGITDTPMLRQHLGTGPEGEENIRKRISRVPLGSILTPEDLARAALYLVSEDSAGITGITHVVDGGLLAAAEYNVPL